MEKKTMTISKEGLQKAISDMEWDRHAMYVMFDLTKEYYADKYAYISFNDLTRQLESKLHILNLLTGENYHYTREGIFNGDKKVSVDRKYEEKILV